MTSGQYISADFTTLLKQADDTAATYLNGAVRAIDEGFGVG